MDVKEHIDAGESTIILNTPLKLAENGKVERRTISQWPSFKDILPTFNYYALFWRFEVCPGCGEFAFRIDGQ